MNEILTAREKRQELRKGTGFSTITFNLNIPGYPKKTELIERAFNLVSKEIKEYLSFYIKAKSVANMQDEAGFYLNVKTAEKDLKSIKKLVAAFEKVHPIGRLIDIDVYASNGERISSENSKECLLCSSSVWQCIKEGKHSQEELRAKVDELLVMYVSSETSDVLAWQAVKSLIVEVGLGPKPGLVSLKDNGPHKDMNHSLFIDSAAVLFEGYKEMADLAEDEEFEPELVFQKMRKIGLKMETEMLVATGGVNTHKGAIFLIGLLVTASARVFKETRTVEMGFISELVREMTQGVVQELKEELGTHGCSIFQEHGFKGARGEAESGMDRVFDVGFPALAANIDFGLTKNEAALASLVSIISENDDTNLVFRGGIEKLETVKMAASNIIDMGFWNEDSLMTYQELCDYCLENNLSCGGSADILACSLFVFFISNYKFY
jgi:holo-ACP synthase / triphosphoribosyl-dephospho-CoA synthase